MSHTGATASRTTSSTAIQSELRSDEPLSLRTRVYFQERLRHRLYDLVIGEFVAYKARGHTQAELARRLGKRSEQISRWLSAPGNLTLDTISDLLLALSEAELAMSLDHPAQQPDAAAGAASERP